MPIIDIIARVDNLYLLLLCNSCISSTSDLCIRITICSKRIDFGTRFDKLVFYESNEKLLISLITGIILKTVLFYSNVRQIPNLEPASLLFYSLIRLEMIIIQEIY